MQQVFDQNVSRIDVQIEELPAKYIAIFYSQSYSH